MIYLYFDNPDDVLKKHFNACHKVTVLDSIQGDMSHTSKQALNATSAYKKCRTDWLVHIDADELIYSNSDVGGVLSKINPEIDQFRLHVWEAVFKSAAKASQSFGTTHFRKNVKSGDQEAVISRHMKADSIPMFRRGLTGHTAGKAFTRVTGADVCGGVHVWNPASAKVSKIHRLREGIYLLHFDAVSYFCWNRKLANRIRDSSKWTTGQGQQRLHQLEAYKKAYDPDSDKLRRELFETLYCPSDEMRSELRRLGCYRNFSWKRRSFLEACRRWIRLFRKPK